MKQKIFLLIATFCIAQVKSYAVGYPGGFPNDVLLSDVLSLWGADESKPSCVHDCYKKRNEDHRQAIVTFSEQILNAANEMKKKLGTGQDFKRHGPKVPNSANKLGNLLKEYQEKFSDLIKNGKLNEVQTLMKTYREKIAKIEEKLNNDFALLKNRTVMKFDLDVIKKCEEAFEIELTKVTDACKEVMGILKPCIEKKCKK